MNKNKTKKLAKILCIIILLTVVAANIYKPFIPAKEVFDTSSMANKASENLIPSKTLVQNLEKDNAPIPDTEVSQPEPETTTETSVTELETTQVHIEEPPATQPTTELNIEQPSTTISTTEPTTKLYIETPTTTKETTALVAKEVQSASPAAMEQQAFDMLNELRKANGVKPLKFENSCLKAARKRATESVEYWSHTRPDGTKYNSVFTEFNLTENYTWSGENLVKEFRTLDSAMNALENSEGHRNNMLRAEFDAVAIGICEMEDGKFALCQLFVKYA